MENHKTNFSKGLPKNERRSKTRVKCGERGIWQHAIRDNYETYMDYLHFNPVKHGWVKNVADWPYSGLHKYLKNGLYSNNWTGNLAEEINGGG